MIPIELPANRHQHILTTGSTFNAAAVAACARDLCARLIEFCVLYNKKNPPPATQLAHPSRPGEPWPDGAWKAAVGKAESARFNLSSQQRVAIPGGTKLDDTGLFYHDAPPPDSKPTANDESNYNFTGYTYSAAIAEVEVDVLTGETTVLQADIVYDMGLSQNPASIYGHRRSICRLCVTFRRKNSPSCGELVRRLALRMWKPGRWCAVRTMRMNRTWPLRDSRRKNAISSLQDH